MQVISPDRFYLSSDKTGRCELNENVTPFLRTNELEVPILALSSTTLLHSFAFSVGSLHLIGMFQYSYLLGETEQAVISKFYDEVSISR